MLYGIWCMRAQRGVVVDLGLYACKRQQDNGHDLQRQKVITVWKQPSVLRHVYRHRTLFKNSTTQYRRRAAVACPTQAGATAHTY